MKNWKHDQYDDWKQAPKSDAEIVKQYGYNIRDKGTGSSVEGHQSGSTSPRSSSSKTRKRSELRRKSKQRELEAAIAEGQVVPLSSVRFRGWPGPPTPDECFNSTPRSKTPAQDRLLRLQASTTITQGWQAPCQRQVMYVEVPEDQMFNPTMTYTAPISMVPSQMVINFIKPGTDPRTFQRAETSPPSRELTNRSRQSSTSPSFDEMTNIFRPSTASSTMSSASSPVHEMTNMFRPSSASSTMSSASSPVHEMSNMFRSYSTSSTMQEMTNMFRPSSAASTISSASSMIRPASISKLTEDMFRSSPVSTFTKGSSNQPQKTQWHHPTDDECVPLRVPHRKHAFPTQTQIPLPIIHSSFVNLPT